MSIHGCVCLNAVLVEARGRQQGPWTTCPAPFAWPLKHHYKCSTFSNKCRVLIFKYVHDFQYVEQIVSKIYFYLIETYVIKSNKTMFVTNFYKFLSCGIPSCTLINNLKIIYSKVYVSCSQQWLDLEIGHILLMPHHLLLLKIHVYKRPYFASSLDLINCLWSTRYILLSVKHHFESMACWPPLYLEMQLKIMA